MKKRLYLLGTLTVALLTATVVMNSSDIHEGSYESRSSNNLHQTNGSDGMFDYYHKMRGDFTHEEYLRAKQDVAAMPVDRATITWYEHGPDNVGGRCRAILIDNDDINHIYAGSVSGGLFESINRSNFWTPVYEFDANLAVSSLAQMPNGTVYVGTGHQREQISGSQNAYDSGANGDGVYEQQTDGTWTLIAGTDSYDWVNEVRCDTVNNVLWIACNQGLKTYTPGGSVTDVTVASGGCSALSISPDGDVLVSNFNGKTYTSKDGGVNWVDRSSTANTSNPISAGSSRTEYAISLEKENGKYYMYASAANAFLTGIWMSTDNGDNWTQIAPANNQQPGSFSPFSTGGGSGQGTYDNIITAVKGNPKKLILGGIDTYSWSTTGNWTQLSQWFLSPTHPSYVHADNHEMVWDKNGRLYIGNDGGVQFSDDEGQTFHPANRGFNVTQFYAIGASAHGDVIGGSQDNGTWANYHDNSTYHEFDEVGGGDGFSATISYINRDINFSSVYYSSVSRSADRGVSSTGFMPDDFSPAGLLNCNPGATDGSGCGQFFTNFELWENPNDLNSTDSVSYVPSEAYSANDVVVVPSYSTGVSIDYVTPTDVVYDDTVIFNSGLTTEDTVVTSIAPSLEYNLKLNPYTFVTGGHPISVGDSIYFTALDTTIEVLSYDLIDHYWGTNALRPGKVLDMDYDTINFGIAWDTLLVQDPYQSWFAIGLGGGNGVWMTRNALRFSAPAEDWFQVNTSSLSGEVSSMEFSRDGNHLFIGTWTGALYRLSDFGDIYSPAKYDDFSNPNDSIFADTLLNALGSGTVQTSWDLIENFSGPVTGIAAEDDGTHLVVSLGGFGNGKVRETTDALGASPGFTDIGGTKLAGLPCYSVIIDRNDPDLIVVGTDMGVYFTENGGADWANCSGLFGNSPVFDMLQNWRTWDEGCLRPGEIYIGIHGRGIWASDALLSLPTSQDNLTSDKFIPNINVYPNPLNDYGTIAFDLASSADVTVQIFNLSGQLVREIKENNLSSGNNQIGFDAADLPKGAYIIRLNAGDKVETSKFIKH
jgi:hypothetical protein